MNIMSTFKKSKLKQTCYHGTDSKPFVELDKSKIQKSYSDGEDAGYFGWGFYMTTDRDYAEEFGDNVLEFEVNIENPFVLPGKFDANKLLEFVFDDAGDSLYEKLLYTMVTFKTIGNGKGGDFKNKNPKALNAKCIELYNKCIDEQKS